MTGKRALRFGIAAVLALSGMGAAGLYGLRAWRDLTAEKKETVPVAKVVRGDVILEVTAKGELRGGNPDALVAPSTGGGELHLTELRENGEAVRKDDVIAAFDTTEQEFRLREATSDVAEVEQRLAQATATRDAQAEEDGYALVKARADVRLAELDARKNPMLPVITARQNTLALEGARDRLSQLEKNLANRKATNAAAIAIQDAARAKAQSQAVTAQRNIDNMKLRAHRDGYVSVKQNTNQNMSYFGMMLPTFQLGDTVRPGQAVAEIQDLKDWLVDASISELDRGHITVGQLVNVTVVAAPGRAYTGHVKEMGGTTGSPWDRRFLCRITLDNPSPELRPGMSANLVVTTDQLKGVLSLPAQALFENDGKTFVYVGTPEGFTPKDVKLVRRNEMRVVIEGLNEGQSVALANPTDQAKKKGAAGPGAALPK
jgi:multidrug resistance efflux pump